MHIHLQMQVSYKSIYTVGVRRLLAPTYILRGVVVAHVSLAAGVGAVAAWEGTLDRHLQQCHQYTHTTTTSYCYHLQRHIYQQRGQH